MWWLVLLVVLGNGTTKIEMENIPAHSYCIEVAESIKSDLELGFAGERYRGPVYIVYSCYNKPGVRYPLAEE